MWCLFFWKEKEAARSSSPPGACQGAGCLQFTFKALTLPYAGLLPPSPGAPHTPQRDTSQTPHRPPTLASVGRVPTGDPCLCALGVAGRVVPTEPVPAPHPLRPRRVRGERSPQFIPGAAQLPSPTPGSAAGGAGAAPAPAPTPSPRVPRSRSAGTWARREVPVSRGRVGPGAGEGRAVPMPPG